MGVYNYFIINIYFLMASITFSVILFSLLSPNSSSNCFPIISSFLSGETLSANIFALAVLPHCIINTTAIIVLHTIMQIITNTIEDIHGEREYIFPKIQLSNFYSSHIHIRIVSPPYIIRKPINYFFKYTIIYILISQYIFR